MPLNSPPAMRLALSPRHLLTGFLQTRGCAGRAVMADPGDLIEEFAEDERRRFGVPGRRDEGRPGQRDWACDQSIRAGRRTSPDKGRHPAWIGPVAGIPDTRFPDCWAISVPG